MEKYPCNKLQFTSFELEQKIWISRVNSVNLCKLCDKSDPSPLSCHLKTQLSRQPLFISQVSSYKLQSSENSLVLPSYTFSHSIKIILFRHFRQTNLFTFYLMPKPLMEPIMLPTSLLLSATYFGFLPISCFEMRTRK